jgi:hypothetical protein
MGVTLSGAALVFHPLVGYWVLRGFRLGALVSEACLVVAGVGMWIVARQRGGDWAGMAILGALFFVCLGILLLVLTLAGLWIIRRLSPVIPGSFDNCGPGEKGAFNRAC